MNHGYVIFTQPIPVVGTSQRREEFDVRDGWSITEEAGGVTLQRAANPEQNVVAVPAFRVTGVGYAVPHDTKAAQLREMVTAGLIDEATARGASVGATEAMLATMPDLQEHAALQQNLQMRRQGKRR